MDRAKQKRLEAAGWRMGTVAEFFNLSPEEAAYVELRVRLSEALRKRRNKRGISQVALATALGSSQSRVAKMEGQDPSVTIDLLIRGLIATGTSLAELARIVGFPEPAPIVVSETKTSTEGDPESESLLEPIIHTMFEATNTNAMRVTLP